MPDVSGAVISDAMIGTAALLDGYEPEDQGTGLVDGADAAVDLSKGASATPNARVESTATGAGVRRLAAVGLALAVIVVAWWALVHGRPEGDSAASTESLGSLLNDAESAALVRGVRDREPILEDAFHGSSVPGAESDGGGSGDADTREPVSQVGLTPSASLPVDASVVLVEQLNREGEHLAAARVCEAVIASGIGYASEARLLALHIESLARAGDVNAATRAAEAALQRIGDDQAAAAWVYLACSYISEASGDHTRARVIREDLAARAADEGVASAAVVLLVNGVAASAEGGGD